MSRCARRDAGASRSRVTTSGGLPMELLMSPITHFLAGWVVANSANLNRRERAAVTLAGVIPDVD